MGNGSGSKAQIIIALLSLIGVLGGALIANWDKISPPQAGPGEQNNGIPHPEPAQISGTYLMDNQGSRVIVVTHINGNRYRIEEPSSPWPWEGQATLDGGELTGEGSFRNSSASMKVEGTVREDRTIVVQYIFLRADDGGDPKGRVDRHTWYPRN